MLYETSIGCQQIWPSAEQDIISGDGNFKKKKDYFIVTAGNSLFLHRSPDPPTPGPWVSSICTSILYQEHHITVDMTKVFYAHNASVTKNKDKYNFHVETIVAKNYLII